MKKINFKNKINIIASFVALSGCSSLAPSGTETALKYLSITKDLLGSKVVVSLI